GEDQPRHYSQPNRSQATARHSLRLSVAQRAKALCQDARMERPYVGRRLMVSTVDYHTAGEPFRIVSGGVPPLPGRTILEKRRFALEHLDHIRQLLVFEPRGHAD